MKPYPSSLTDDQWALIEPLVPPAWEGGRPRKHDMRLVIDALLYIAREGCRWRALPHDFPPWKTIYNYFVWFRVDGSWDRINAALVVKVRESEGCEPEPSAGCIDSQSTKSACGGEEIGKDGNKKVHGRKRHVITDTLGMILAVLVTAANVDDGAAAPLVMERLTEEQTSRLELVFADQKYHNLSFEAWLKERGYRLEISQREAGVKIFVPMKCRWVVEQTFGCLTLWRRLNREYEKDPKNSETMLKLASIHRMARRLCPTPPASPFRYREAANAA